MKVNKSVILTASACIGVAATAYVSFNAGRQYERGGKQFPPAHSKTLFIPPIVIGGLTITAIVLNQRLNAKTIMGLAGSAGYIALNRDELERQIEEKYGKDALKELKQKAASMLVQKVDTEQVELTGLGDVLCVDGYSGRLYRSGYDAVCKGVAEFQEAWESGQYLSMNDFYEMQGMRQTAFGSQWGFPNNKDYLDGPIEIEVTFVDKSEILPWSDYAQFQEDIIVVDWYTYPMEGWMEV